MSAAGQLPAFPCQWLRGNDGDGLTKRELFAAMALMGFCACSTGGVGEDMAGESVALADDLIAELAKDKS